MNKNEWYQIGEDIKKQVQEAIDSNNFSELSKTIGETVGQAVGDVGKSLNGAFNDVVNEARESFQQTKKKASDHNQQFYNSQGYQTQYNNTQNFNAQGYDAQNGNANPQQQQGRPKWARYNGSITYGKPNLRPDAKLFNRHPAGSVSGIVYMALGFSAMGIAGVGMSVFMFLVMFGVMGLNTLIPWAAATVAGFIAGLYGTKLRGRTNRFKRYVDLVKDKLYCSIEELAQKTGRSQRFVRKDLKKMMQKGMFFQAHLDKKEQCFIASDSVYEQYRLTQQNYEQKQQTEQGSKVEEQQKANAEEVKQNRSEAQKVLDEGREYVRMIRICNDEIPGEEMSEKLDKLELLVTRIFAQVEKEPELAPELHKMLNYYLPTTQKLLEAYRDLDKQNLEVKNISDTKKEIENTVDTINSAFEKFLDELFREKAWDIQSDISVLNTMLKQDGYLKNDFEKQ